MTQHDRQKDAPDAERLPVDLTALALSVAIRWRVFVAFAVLAVFMGALGGVKFGVRVWESETVMLYKPFNDPSGGVDAPTLTTQMSMVKIQTNLEEVRRRLNLQSTVQAVGNSSDVYVQKETTLMVIRSDWNDPVMAARLANTVRDVFLDNQREIRKKQAVRQIDDLRFRIEEVGRELRGADQNLQRFKDSHGVVDLDKEAQWYLDELVSTNLMLEQARVEKKALAQQLANIDPMIAGIRSRIAQEEKENASAEELGTINIRLGRLRSSIDDDRNLRANTADLAQKELELHRAEKMKGEGLISEVEYQNAVKNYEKQKALTLDTDQIKGWKEQISRLDNVVMPSAGGKTESAPLLKDLMLKAFDLQLSNVAVEEKVKHLEKAQADVQEKLARLPRLQQDFIALSREVVARSEEKKTLEDAIAKQSRIRDSLAVDFTIIADAKPSTFPSRSNRRTITILFGAVFFFMGLLAVVVLSFMDTTIKTGKEASFRTRSPLLGVLRRLTANGRVYPDEGESDLADRFRVMAGKLRSMAPRQGARILVACTRPGEGRTTVVSNLAKCFGNRGERVLLVDGRLHRPGGPRDGKKGLSEESAGAGSGLGSPPPGRPLQVKGAGRPSVNKLKKKIKTLPWLYWPLKIVWTWVQTQYERERRAHGEGAFQGKRRDLSDFIRPGLPQTPGLGDYLSGATTDWSGLPKESVMANAWVVARSALPPAPDSIASPLAKSLMDEFSRQYSLVFIETAPVEESSEAQLWMDLCDAVVYVVRSRDCRAGRVKKAMEPFHMPGSPPLSVVLNGVERPFPSV